MLILTLAALPIRYNEVSTTGTAPEQLTTEDGIALQHSTLTVEMYGKIYIVMAATFALAHFLLGALIFYQRSDDWQAVLFSLAFITYGPTNLYLLHSLPSVYPLTRFLVDLAKGASYGIVGFMMYVFPDGKPYPRSMFPLTLAWLGYMLLWPFFPGSVLDFQTWSGSAFFILLIAWFGVGTWAAILRYQRKLTTTQKQQVKWLIYGFVVIMVGYTLSYLPQLIFPGLSAPGLGHVLTLLVSNIVYVTAMFITLIAVCVAILRYRLFEIDSLINRSLVYGTLTIGLGAIFTLVVIVLQQVFFTVSGNQGSPMAIASAALVIGSLYQPTRRRLQSAVDRRFFRYSIDLSRFDSTVNPVKIPFVTNLSGKTLGSYRVEELIGRGGMAEVYKGRHTNLNRLVAIKILPPDRAQQVDFRARFEREARTVAGLRHPCIVQVFDYGVVDDTYYMVMEYVAGNSLSDYIARNAPLRLSEAIRLSGDIASALDYAHEQGIVHRDVKPSNIMLQKISIKSKDDPAVRAVLMDFGIAKIVTGTSGLTRTGTMGTLDYIAPEQILSSATVDKSVDIYALGIITYLMLTGHLPFQGNPGAIVFAHLQTPPPDPRKFVASIPERTVAALDRALEKDPKKRFATASEFVRALG
jgi:serine/threonine-protein kinase